VKDFGDGRARGASGDVLINGAITQSDSSNYTYAARLMPSSSSIARTIKEPMQLPVILSQRGPE